MPADPIQEIGCTDWLTDPDGSESKFHFGHSPDGYYYAVDSAPQDDEQDYLCWSGPYAAKTEMEDAAWSTRDTGLALPRPSPPRRVVVQPR